MFQLDPKPTFAATVQVSVPGGDSQPLQVVFRHKTKSKLAEFQKDVRQGDLEMALEVVESVVDKPDGLSLQQFFEALFENYPAAPLDLYFTYVRELSASRVKN